MPLSGGVSPHGAAKHTDVTRELFIPANACYIAAGTSGLLSQHQRVSGGANADEPDVHFSLKVPDDFVSFGSVKAVWAAVPASGNMYWRILANYGASGEDYAAHTDSPAIGVTATGGATLVNVQEPANPLTLSSLAAGDYIGIRFFREGTHASDTINDVVYLLGILFTYTASQ